MSSAVQSFKKGDAIVVRKTGATGVVVSASHNNGYECRLDEGGWSFFFSNEISAPDTAPRVWRKSTLVSVEATGERGTVLRKLRGEHRYEVEMSDGTFAYFSSDELRETRLDELDATRVDLELLEAAANTATVNDEANDAQQPAETVETFSLAEVLEGVINPTTLRARREWELDRDTLINELHTTERECDAIKRSESAYSLCRDRYFANLAAAHRNVARKASALSAHYAEQSVR